MSKHETIYAVLRDHLTSDLLKPGLVLTETAVAQLFDVSRAPAAEALNRLVKDGLLFNHTGRGFVVGDGDTPPFRQELAAAGLRLPDTVLLDLKLRGARDRLYPSGPRLT